MTRPIRSCLGCGLKQEKQLMARFTVDAGGLLVLDVLGALGGRGVYSCKNEQCRSRLIKGRKRLMQALRVTELVVETMSSFDDLAKSRDQGKDG